MKILMLEDVPEEAEWVERELRKSGLTFTAQRVQTKEQFTRAIEELAPDLILADSKLPAFDGREALEWVKQRHPETPVIMVTGALGDEAAVEFLIAGASDYVLKDRLARLGLAVRRVLREQEASRSREQLEQALRDAAHEERRRLAQELHDGLGQELTGLAMLADGLLKQAAREGRIVPPELTRLAVIARQAIKTCRDIAHGVSPLGGAQGGLIDALRELTSRLSGPPGPAIALTFDLQATIDISHEASEHLYRIAQEALANAIKHSGATSIQVRLEVDTDSVRLRVIDNGRGFAAVPAGVNGLGLRTMRSRAHAMGGRLSIGAREGGGAVLTCEVPQHNTASRVAAR
jgi:signal transduction histidine kinase